MVWTVVAYGQGQVSLQVDSFVVRAAHPDANYIHELVYSDPSLLAIQMFVDADKELKKHKRAYSHKPDKLRNVVALAESYILNTDYEAAQAILSDYHLVHPSGANVFGTLVRLHLALGDTAEARGVLDKYRSAKSKSDRDELSLALTREYEAFTAKPFDALTYLRSRPLSAASLARAAEQAFVVGDDVHGLLLGEAAYLYGGRSGGSSQIAKSVATSYRNIYRAAAPQVHFTRADEQLQSASELYKLCLVSAAVELQINDSSPPNDPELAVTVRANALERYRKLTVTDSTSFSSFILATLLEIETDANVDWIARAQLRDVYPNDFDLYKAAHPASWQTYSKFIIPKFSEYAQSITNFVDQ